MIKRMLAAALLISVCSLLLVGRASAQVSPETLTAVLLNASDVNSAFTLANRSLSSSPELCTSFSVITANSPLASPEGQGRYLVRS